MTVARDMTAVLERVRSICDDVLAPDWVARVRLRRQVHAVHIEVEHFEHQPITAGWSAEFDAEIFEDPAATWEPLVRAELERMREAHT